jgi:hypothetical protein
VDTPHLRSTLFQRPDRLTDPLYVVTALYNSARYRSRWKHYEDFCLVVEQAGAKLLTVEVAFGARSHVKIQGPMTIELRTSHEMFFKENVQTVGVQHLPSDWNYVALVDGDVRWVRDDWANETLHRLQHYAVVQMWTEYQDMTEDHELIGTTRSFLANYVDGALDGYKPKSANGGTPAYPYGYGGRRGYPGAPGLAWAYRKSAWNALGGMLDCCILGAGDWYMVHGLTGLGTEAMVNRRNHPHYRQAIFEWWDRAKTLRKNVGVVPGLILHRWHGPKVHRKYGSREQILIDCQFDPRTHVSRDWQGLLQFTPQVPIALRDRVRQYLHERQEDK